MSGTSRDSLDGCLVSFSNGLEIKNLETIYFSKDYQSSDNQSFISEEITQKSIDLVKKLISNHSKENIIAIAFPGQTISHSDEFSLQAGSPEIIAKESGIPVYADFRNFDIAHGGKGAPLIPLFHQYLLSDNSKNKLIINIGGIANGTYLKGPEIELASDVGPGNCLMDEAMRKLGLGLYDNDGLLARSGNINDEILELFMNELQNLSYPRADDISVYMNILEKYESEILNIAPADALCTLAELTATKIIEFLKSCNSVDELIFHGGGTENKYLMSRIKELTAIPVKSIDDVAPSKYIEAIAFAYLAFQERAILFK
tara:strand:- start:59 stop:1006 length:948 start_codon:yes stop_codon:yes gene_type:complete